MKPERINRAQLLILRQQGWKDKPAGLYEPDHAPRGTRFVLVIDLPTGSFRRLEPPKE